MRRLKSAGITGALLAVVLAQAGCVQMMPSKGRERVTVQGQGAGSASNVCGGFEHAFAVNTPVVSGLLGSAGDFTIPPDKVFVITNWQWQLSQPLGSGTVFLASGGATLTNAQSQLAGDRAVGSQWFDPVVVPPGMPICAGSNVPFTLGQVSVYGFFAPPHLGHD